MRHRRGRGRARSGLAVAMVLAAVLGACTSGGSGEIPADDVRWHLSVDFCTAPICGEAATDEEVADVEEQLRAAPGVTEVAAFDAPSVHAAMSEIAPLVPEDLQGVGPRLSARVDAVAALSRLLADLDGLPGVDDVVTHEGVDRIRDAIDADPFVGTGYCHECRAGLGIFLCDDNECPAITLDEREQLSADLQADPDVASVSFESKEDAFALFRERFGHSSELMSGVTAEQLPASFRVSLVDGVEPAAWGSRYAGRAGVEEIVEPQDVTDAEHQRWLVRSATVMGEAA